MTGRAEGVRSFVESIYTPLGGTGDRLRVASLNRAGSITEEFVEQGEVRFGKALRYTEEARNENLDVVQIETCLSDQLCRDRAPRTSRHPFVDSTSSGPMGCSATVPWWCSPSQRRSLPGVTCGVSSSRGCQQKGVE